MRNPTNKQTQVKTTSLAEVMKAMSTLRTCLRKRNGAGDVVEAMTWLTTVDGRDVPDDRYQADGRSRPLDYD